MLKFELKKSARLMLVPIILAGMIMTPSLAANSPTTQTEPQFVSKPQTNQSTLANYQKNHTTTVQPDHKISTRLWHWFKTKANFIQDRLRSSEIPRSAQMGLVFLLGILMSLTPCIYPVIPLTVGALQSQRSQSLGFSFLLSLCYATGLSSTFAIMGLIAATSGQLFGSFANHPFFVLMIIAQLAYMAGSMFGWYEIYIPRFMQANNSSLKAGSLLSAFGFGIISGSVASPCLSPGLALLLTIVTTMGSKLLGFMLLFSFGLGLSAPLILIGTCSNAINFLPRAGMWMVEIKKLFGFMLIGMCLFFLNKILLTCLVLWLAVIITAYSAYCYYRCKQAMLLAIFALLTLALTILAGHSTYTYLQVSQTMRSNAMQHAQPHSLTEYQAYCAQARADQKLLLLDFGAEWCTICRMLDQKIFHNPAYQTLLNRFIVLKIDATDPQNEPYHTLKTQYQIVGVPTILLVEPHQYQVLQRFGSELYQLNQAEINEKFKVRADC